MRLQGSRRSWLAGCLLIGWSRATSVLNLKRAKQPTSGSYLVQSSIAGPPILTRWHPKSSDARVSATPREARRREFAVDRVTSTAAALMAGECRFFNLLQVRDHIGANAVTTFREMV